MPRITKNIDGTTITCYQQERDCLPYLLTPRGIVTALLLSATLGTILGITHGIIIGL